MARLEPGAVDLIVIDSFYRAVPEGNNENDNAQMTLLMNEVDAAAMRIGAAIVLIAHNPKGDVSERAVSDLVAGAGAITRACDNIIAFRRHEVDDCFVVQAKLRDHPELEPFVIEKKYPIFVPRSDLDPDKICSVSSQRKKKAARQDEDGPGTPPPAPSPSPEPWTPAGFAQTFLSQEPKEKSLILAKARQAGIKNRQVDDLLALAIDGKQAFRWTGH